eukprot:gene2779-3782_t
MLQTVTPSGINAMRRDRPMLLPNKEISVFDVQATQSAGCGGPRLEALFDKHAVERFAPGTAIFFQGDPA